MSRTTEGKGFTRRDFVKTVGLAGLAVAGSGVTGAMAAPEAPAAAKATIVPKRPWARPGWTSPSLTWAACSTPSTTNCSSSRP